jgi:hypothetical protein
VSTPARIFIIRPESSETFATVCSVREEEEAAAEEDGLEEEEVAAEEDGFLTEALVTRSPAEVAAEELPEEELPPAGLLH